MLLILASITITALIGDNGILSKANKSKEETIIAAEKEQIALAYNSVKIEKLKKEEKFSIKAIELQNELNRQNAKTTVNDNEAQQKIVIIFEESKNQYTLDKDGKIEGPTTSKEEKEILQQIESKVTNLENKTTMKYKAETVTDIGVIKATWVTIVSLTVEEDCYADIYGFYSIDNEDSDAYKGINILLNGVSIASHGKGGTGGIVANDVNCVKELKKGDVISLSVAQWAKDTANIKFGTIRINYFPKSNLKNNEENTTLEDLEQRVANLEKRTTVEMISDVKTDTTIERGVNTKIASIVIPEDCYADIYGEYQMQNDNSQEYKGIHLYQNGNWIADNGKGGNGLQVEEEVRCTMRLNKGDVIDLYANQYTGTNKNILNSRLQIYYMPLTEGMVEGIENKTRKERIENLNTKVATLENRTTMKILESSIEASENKQIISGQTAELMSFTIEEDCYANIYGLYSISNNNNSAYKGICIYKNNERMVIKGKGGTGGDVADSISYMTELKKGDKIILYVSQYTGSTQTIRRANFRIHYFPK